ncbi:MAG: hypothetical protein RLN69_07215, partial [Woeseiaceae bacterium]
MTTRREALQFCTGVTALAIGGCCARGYPVSKIDTGELLVASVPPYLGPKAHTPDRRSVLRVIDAHAHFFNASDVPVRDFLGKSIAHGRGAVVEGLLKLLALLAEAIATSAPTAAEELAALDTFESSLPKNLSVEEAARRWDILAQQERENAARRVADVIAGSKFARRYRQITREAPSRWAKSASDSSPVTYEEVLDILDLTESPRSDSALGLLLDEKERNAAIADGILGFLFYLLSMRALNLDSYRCAFTDTAADLAFSSAIGAMVDFDYWLDCPPASSHDDQITLHQRLSERSGQYMR